MLGKTQENPVADEWKARYEALSTEVQAEIDAVDKMNAKEYQLNVIKRNNPKLKDGDIFLLNPVEGVYYYGKVMKANINHIKKDAFVHGKCLVFIFNCFTEGISIDAYKADYNDLLISPTIVDISYWNKGYFYNIGNEPITDEERNLDYGLLRIGIKSNVICKEDGTVLEKKPKILGIYGISTMTGVASRIRKEIIIQSNEPK